MPLANPVSTVVRQRLSALSRKRETVDSVRALALEDASASVECCAGRQHVVDEQDAAADRLAQGRRRRRRNGRRGKLVAGDDIAGSGDRRSAASRRRSADARPSPSAPGNRGRRSGRKSGTRHSAAERPRRLRVTRGGRQASADGRAPGSLRLFPLPGKAVDEVHDHVAHHAAVRHPHDRAVDAGACGLAALFAHVGNGLTQRR